MRFNHSGVISEIDNLPGCSQIAVSHSAYVPKEKQGQGLGTKAHRNRLIETEILGYDVIMCTAVLTNEPQCKILANNGWKMVHSFVSSKTNNSVGIFIRDI